MGEYAILKYYNTDQPELHLEENKEVTIEEDKQDIHDIVIDKPNGNILFTENQ